MEDNNTNANGVDNHVETGVNSQSTKEYTDKHIEEAPANDCNHKTTDMMQKPHERDNTPSDKTDKAAKVKAKRNRELNTLEENKIMHSRLRSESGKVYTSSVTVDASTSSNTPSLDSLNEESESDMCSQDCCRKSDQIISMITKLQSSIDDMTKKFSIQERTQASTLHQVHDVQQQCDANGEAIDDLQGELKDTKFQLKVMANILAKQDEQISMLNNKIIQIQQREMNPNVVITGIPETHKEKTVQLFNDFVLNQLEIQELIPAERAFRIGVGESRPLVVQLRDPAQKGKLFGNATKLKGKKNSKGSYFFLSDHLPESMNEAKRRVNDLFNENKKKQAPYQLDMEFRKGQLIINQELYTKSVKVPPVKTIINPTDEVYDKAIQMDIIKGGEERKAGSYFASFITPVNDHDEINSAYLKLKMKYADATHISCAYRLPGVNSPQNQDYVDDGEYGCGRVMLKTLKEAKLMNIAVFMMRQYGGKHIGPQRFQIFKKLTEQAISSLTAQRQATGQEPVQPLPDNLRTPMIPPDEWTPANEDWTTPSDKKTD